MSVFTYLISKSMWRIWITLDARWYSFSKFNARSIKISDKLFFAQETKLLAELEVKFLKLGLKLMADQIDELFKDEEPIVIVVQEVSFNICDYQEEGMAGAIIGWVSREFKLIEPNIEVTFDKPNNRYVFQYQDLQLAEHFDLIGL